MTRLSEDGFRLVSNSEVQTFKSCRRRWWLGWYLGLRPRTQEVQGVRSIGTRLHIAAAEYYRPGTGGGSITAAMKALEEAQDADLKVFQGETDGFGFLPDATALRKDFQLERIMLEGYFDWLKEEGADQFLQVVSSEQYVEAPFLEGNARRGRHPVKIIGKLDTRVVDVRSGEPKFLDHKTVSAFDKPEVLKLNEQTLHYQLLEWLSSETGEARCWEALYNMMRRVKRTATAKPPFYQRVSLRRNQHELDSYRYQLTGAITDMQDVEHQLKYTGEDDPHLLPMLVYKTASRDCAWKCEFFKVCHMFDDGSRVEAALEAFYESGDPLSYYQGKEGEEE
jgi:hypothetical protein